MPLGIMILSEDICKDIGTYLLSECLWNSTQGCTCYIKHCTFCNNVKAKCLHVTFRLGVSLPSFFSSEPG